MKIAARVEDVSHAFGAIRAVDRVSLEVAPGEILGIVGPDGAGKTTLIRCWVPVIRAAEAARIEVGGHDARANAEAVRPFAGYMPQKFSLYEDLTVDENISFYADVHGVPLAEAAKRRADLLQFTRLAPFSARRAGKLSGGMKQKLGLICVLIHRPAVLFLDEPTNGVDPVSRREFWEILRALVQGFGESPEGASRSPKGEASGTMFGESPERASRSPKGEASGTMLGEESGLARVAIVVTTPYMDEAERCHRVAMMDAGRVRATGTPDELRRRVPGTVLEVNVSEPLRARDIVARAADDPSVAVFGTRLRARSRKPAADRAVADALRTAGFASADVTVVPPSMEDVFVALTRDATP